MKNCLRCNQPLEENRDKYGMHTRCFLAWFKLDESQAGAEFSSLARRSAESKDPLRERAVSSFISSFFHGTFRKYSAELAGESYILKVRDENAPELPEVEYLCNQIGSILGLPIADHYIIELFGDRAFVTKNFIKKGMGASNLVHIYHYFEEEQFTCESLIKIIQSETKRPYDVEVFIHTCIYDALIGNHDRHGRNLGLIVTHQKTTLSPIYDNTSVLGLETGDFLKADFNPKGKIYTSASTEPSIRDYVIEFKRLGFVEEVLTFLQRINQTKIHALIEDSFCTDNMKDSMKRLFDKRLAELIDETKK
jgi:hypothetical protein